MNLVTKVKKQMKISFIKSVIGALFLLIAGMTMANAATPMLYFSSQPGNTSLDGTTTLSYVVHNNVPSPMPLTSFSFTSSPDYTASITNNCSSSGYAVVPSNGDCTISVALTSAVVGTTNNAKLVIGYSNQPGTQLISNGITVTTTAHGSVSFTAQPSSPQSVTINGIINLSYQVTNTTGIAQPLSNLSFSASSRYTVGSIAVTGSGTCSSSIVPSTGSCTITVPITGVSQGQSSGQLSVSYGSTPIPISGSNVIVINISGSSVTPLTFTTQPTSPQSVDTGSSLNLVYIVNNPNASAIAIGSIAFTANALYNPTQSAITPSGAGCTLSSIPASSSCTYTVNITAGSTAGTASNQKLTIDYTGSSPLNSNPITVNVTSPSSALFFTLQAASTSVTAGGSTNLVYQVTNPGGSPVGFTTSFTTSSLFTSSITNTCSGSVPANGTCNITVAISALSTPGVATNQSLTVDDSSTPITSTPINITVTSTGPQSLNFAPPTQSTWVIGPTGTISIPFTVNNSTGAAVTVSSISFTPSSLYTSAIVVTNSGAGLGCTDTNIPANSTCVVTVTITGTGTAPALALSQLQIDYTGGGPLIYTPPIRIIFTNAAPTLSFGDPMPVIENMPTYMEQTLTFPLQNNTNFNITIPSIVVTSSTGTATDSSVVDYQTNCKIPGQNGIIGAHQVCYVVVTLSSNGSTGTVQQNLQVNYTGGPLTTPISFNVATQTSSRTFTFVNQCRQQISVGINPAAVANTVSTTDTSCTTSSDCNQGASCVLTNPTTGAQQCTWNAPVPADGNYQLAAAASIGATGGIQTITVPYDNNENTWLGGEIFNTGISGRTGCSSTPNSCSTADCSGGIFPSNGACKPSIGFQQPSATGELNLYLGSGAAPASPTDTYDGSIINGFNVPFSITPSISNGRSTNPYACGIPGNQNDVTSTGGTLGGCPWNYPWGANEIYFTYITSPTATTCTPTTNCGTGLVCGVNNMTDTVSNVPRTYCGTFGGYWSAGQACSLNSSLASPFNCTTPLSSGLPLSSWYLCSGGAASNSCYGGTSNNCCGCQDWNTYNPAIAVPASPVVTSCNGVSSTGWTTPAATGIGTPLSFAAVAKQACPSFYSYQYDDSSSTFNCGAAADGLSPHVGVVNTTDYTITFCPGGANGAPG